MNPFILQECVTCCWVCKSMRARVDVGVCMKNRREGHSRAGRVNHVTDQHFKYADVPGRDIKHKVR